MAKSGLQEHDNDHDLDESPHKQLVKESSYYMDNYEATITVHTSPPQHQSGSSGTPYSVNQSSGEYLEIDDETTDVPSVSVLRRKLSKKKNLRVTFSDHIEVDLIPDLYDDVDGDFSDDIVVEETIYDLGKPPGASNRPTSKGSAKFREALILQSPKPVLIGGQTSPDLKVTKENSAPRSPPSSPRRYEQRPKLTSTPKSSKVTSSSHSPPLLHKRRISQSSLGESSEKTTKDFLYELRERRQTQHSQRSMNLNTLFPTVGSSNSKTRSQPSYSSFLSDAKRAVDRSNYVNERPWNKRSPERPVYGLYNQRNSDTHRSAGSVRKSASLPRNFRLPDTLYSGRYRRPGSDTTLLTANLGVK